MTPTHVAAAAPARLTQSVKSPVVPDAETGVGLDIVAGEFAEASPGVEERRPPANDIADHVAALFDRGIQRVREGCERVGWFRQQHRLGWPGRREVDVGHRPNLATGALGSIARVSEPEVASDHPAAHEPAQPPTRLLLVRHAVTAHTGPILSGRMPGIDLSDRGREQANSTAERLAKLPIGAIYASPIERTQQTAAAIARHHDLPVHVLEGVIEAEYGDWTGGEIKDLAKTPEWKVVQAAPSRARFPGGESIQEMQARTVATLDGIVAAHPNRNTVVVSHADPIKSAIAHYTGVHLDLFQRIHVSPASVTVLEFHAFGVMLVKSNDTGTLDELLPPAPESSP